MQAPIRSLIEKFHEQGRKKCCVVVTGAGATSISWILEIPNASRTLLDGAVPYHRNALALYLGMKEGPEKFVSVEAVTMMAKQAYNRAVSFENHNDGGSTSTKSDERQPLGVACTGTIRAGYEKQGPHHAFVAVYFKNSTSSSSDNSNSNDSKDYSCQVYHLDMAKNKRTRVEEEQLVSSLIIHAASLPMLSLDSQAINLFTLSTALNLIAGDVLTCPAIQPK